MKKLTIKRKEVILIANGLSALTGIKDFKKTISLGRDIRLLKKIQEETETALKACKPEKYDQLSDEFNKLKQEKANELGTEKELLSANVIGEHVMLLWSKSDSWNKANEDYNKRYSDIVNEEVEVELFTDTITEKDFDKKPNTVAVGEVLSYFM